MTLNLKKYALHYILTMFGVMGAAMALAALDIDFPDAAGGLMPSMIAAMLAGAKHAETTMQPLAKGEAWRLALPMTLCAAAIQVGFSLVYLFGSGILSEGLPVLLRTISLATWSLLALFVLAVVYLTNRIFLGMGVRNGLKAAQRKASKS
ncbi:ABZJ_00895 family protein [Shimia sp.]|uniref:ABZJ_00895 family protein n=1 Tax=Shimia sp. TaxID=1954381 RepID=UPI003BAD13A0